MSERPILFSAPMVRALLAGTKTQTRRIVKHEHVNGDCPCADVFAFNEKRGEWELGECHEGPTAHVGWLKCPYGKVGDQLWVRETWGVGTRPDPSDGWRDGIEYRADDDGTLGEHDLLPLHEVKVPAGVTLDKYEGKWWPSIHMPRWVSRLSLEITSVRVERLAEISEADAKAEGASMCVAGHGPITAADLSAEPGYWSPNLYRNGFQDLWESINGGASWAANPWVWVLEFKKVDGASTHRPSESLGICSTCRHTIGECTCTFNRG